MKVEKKVLANLNKCYSIAPLFYQGREHFLVAAEKQDPCYLFDTDGNLEDTVWEGPGGVMSMVQVPGTDGQFLATSRFYSPNDSKEAKIVIVTPTAEGVWERRTLAALPHVHRFDILTRDGQNYLIACTLKSGHAFHEDWSMPGKVYAARLPEDLSGYDAEHPLQLSVLKDGMLRNHGYYRSQKDGVWTAVLSCENGIYRFTPPAAGESDWKIELLLDIAASDAVPVDLDEDGEPELCVLAPFHGDSVSIYKKEGTAYRKVYDYPGNAEFAHAIYGGSLCGRPAFVVGHRKGDRKLFAITYDRATHAYTSETIDTDCGPANVFHYLHDGKDILIATNREINEIAMYSLTNT